MSAMKPMTMTEKIIARHAELFGVTAGGDLVDVQVDLVMANDVTAPSRSASSRRRASHTPDPKKVVMVPSHLPRGEGPLRGARLRDHAHLCLKRAVSISRSGAAASSTSLPDRACRCRPGDLIIGADSHTCAVCWCAELLLVRHGQHGYRRRNGDGHDVAQRSARR